MQTDRVEWSVDGAKMLLLAAVTSSSELSDGGTLIHLSRSSLTTYTIITSIITSIIIITISIDEKTFIETQTLRAGCSKAKFSPCRRPPSGGRRMAKIYSAGDGHYLHIQIQFGEDRCTQFRVIVVTDPQTNKHANRQDRSQYTAPLR